MNDGMFSLVSCMSVYDRVTQCSHFYQAGVVIQAMQGNSTAMSMPARTLGRTLIGTYTCTHAHI